jgi:hypothetical protein
MKHSCSGNCLYFYLKSCSGFIGKATGIEMKKSFNILKLFWRNKRPALGLVLVICVLFLQQTSTSALYLCDNSTSSLGKKLCHCCPPVRSPNSRIGSTGMGEIKNSHCKAISKESSQKPGISSFKERAKAITGIQREEQFSIPQVCCQIDKPKAEITDFVISLPTVDLVACPSAVTDSSSLSPPVSHVSISHPCSRPVYLVLSSFLI